jgi:hypothetical protein
MNNYEIKQSGSIEWTKCVNCMIKRWICYDILSYPITIMNSHTGRPNSTRWQHVDMAKQDAQQDGNV